MLQSILKFVRWWKDIPRARFYTIREDTVLVAWEDALILVKGTQDKGYYNWLMVRMLAIHPDKQKLGKFRITMEMVNKMADECRLNLFAQPQLLSIKEEGKLNWYSESWHNDKKNIGKFAYEVHDFERQKAWVNTLTSKFGFYQDNGYILRKYNESKPAGL